MDSRSRHRRARKIRRTGHDTTPSQVEKVAEVASTRPPPRWLSLACWSHRRHFHAATRGERHDGERAGTHRRRGHAITGPGADPRLRCPPRRHAVGDRGAVLRQHGRLDLDLQRQTGP